MRQGAVFLGVVRYEFAMQIRRPFLWLAYALLGMIIVLLGLGTPNEIFVTLLTNPGHVSWFHLLLFWTHVVQETFPIGVSIVLADRLPRDRRTRVDEIFQSLPANLGTRLIGKYLGGSAASLLPIAVFYSLGTICLLIQSHALAAIPMACVTFATIMLPGLAFVAVFSLACPAIMPIPLYWFLFLGYWFWGNLLAPTSQIPTLSSTIFTPLGGYISVGLFGGSAYPIEAATPLQGLESLLFLMGTVVVVLLLLWSFSGWQQGQQ